MRRAEGEQPHSRVPGPGVKGVYLPPGTGGTAGGTGVGGGPEDSVVVAAGVTPAGVPMLEAKSSILTILLTSDNLIFTVSNHSSVCSDMVLEHLLASMMDMDRRFSLSAGIYREDFADYIKVTLT